MTQKLTYHHDGGPFIAEMEIERLPHEGKFYRAEIRFTDPTDYERACSGYIWMFTPQHPPRFELVDGKVVDHQDGFGLVEE